MGFDSTTRRRWFGALLLLAALLMLLAGETVLKGRLNPTTFVIYWLVCFVLTSLAMFVALLDVRALGNRTRQQHRELFESTLKEIEAQARQRRRQGPAKDARPARPDGGGSPDSV